MKAKHVFFFCFFLIAAAAFLFLTRPAGAKSTDEEVSQNGMMGSGMMGNGMMGHPMMGQGKIMSPERLAQCGMCQDHGQMMQCMMGQLSNAEMAKLIPSRAKKVAPQTARWTAPKEAAMVPNPRRADQKSLYRGSLIFQQSCAGCHGQSGRGDGPMAPYLGKKVADLTNPALQAKTDGALYWWIMKGSAPMPSYSGVLSAVDIWDVINYLRRLPKD